MQNQQRKISFAFLGDKYMFFYRVMKHCLHVSVQLVYYDCLKSFGAQPRAHPAFVCGDVEF